MFQISEVQNTSPAINPTLFKKFQQAEQAKTVFADFVADFLDGHVSDQTKRAYNTDMKYFSEFLRSGGVTIQHPRDLQAFHFKAYRDDMQERDLASATIHRRLTAIRSFLKWAVAARFITHNPLDQVRLPKVQTESPTIAFDDSEVLKMINAPDTTTHKGRTQRLVMVLLFNLGLRRSELVNIKLAHIVHERNHIVLKICGKGDKTRYIPLNPTVLLEIENYRLHIKNARRGFALEPGDYLLQSEVYEKNIIPMDGSTIWRIISKFKTKTGIDKQVSPHSCRATVISHLLDTQNASMREVATFAGHSNISTTELYDKRRGNMDKSAAYQVDFK